MDVDSGAFAAPPLVKNPFLDDLEDAALVLVPMAKLAKCLILSRTTLMPRSSLAFNSRTRRRIWLGSNSSLQSARATDVFPVMLVRCIIVVHDDAGGVVDWCRVVT